MNAAICVICGDLIESLSVHHMNTCRCGVISVDGGNEYKKRLGVLCAVYEVCDRDTYEYLVILTHAARIDYILHDMAFVKNWHILCLLFAARNVSLEEQILQLEEELDDDDEEEEEDEDGEEEVTEETVVADEPETQ